MAKNWTCRLRRHHDVIRTNPEAETPQQARYQQCSRCGHIHDDYAKGYGAVLA